MQINHIGKPGSLGFGCGIAPNLPDGFEPMPGHDDVRSVNYGNYIYKDGSVMVYIPRFDVAFKDGKVMVLAPNEPAPDGANLVRMPAFCNGGRWRSGFFYDKYICSKNGKVASSLPGGRVLSSRARSGCSDTPFSSLGEGIENNCAGAFSAAKTRGTPFFVASLQMRMALGILVVAQRQAAEPEGCAWLASDKQWPVGCNDWDLGDKRMPGLTYESDGTYKDCGRTGTASNPAAVSHNGQDSGVMDLNGLVWEVQSGVGERNGQMMCISESDWLEEFHHNSWMAHPNAMAMPTPGYHYIDPTAINAGGIGNALSKQDVGAGAIWVPHTVPKGLCVISGGTWHYGSYAGVWALLLNAVRGSSYVTVGFRAASFL